ncbi:MULTISPECIES: multidrug effflux MFS transporter [unclassified Acinetobacter]|uniref:multidrug effflux MFS transporter n=1 Tax=unclassified Acinetobacter TaxID=196816 RepID=UPI002934677A|nr:MULTISPECIES: multidrug effflux MFS transporter [unclassified Acinetobacter]WOE33265.1 multidrug effflux MFS transporter [Acinetobacter sp. SAAs470]WOE36954.1 multidrug effflux MFS transporter [Acinetobacter sp. SAAs474]
MHSSIPLKIIVSLAMIVALGPAAIDMYLASMPEMAKDLNTTYASTQLTLTVFLIFMGLGQLFFGPISDAIGRKYPLLIGLVLYIGAAFWAASTMSIEALIFARVLQGLGAAMAIVVVMSMVRDLVDDIAATQLYALLNTIVALGPIVAPALGGFIGAHFGWRGVMLSLCAVASIVLLNTLFNIKESLVAKNRIQLNLKNILQTYLGILKHKIFLCNLLALSAVYFFLFAYIGGSSYVYQNDFGLSLEQFGLVFGLTSISLVAGASSSALMIKKVSAPFLAMMGALLMMLGSVMCIMTYVFDIGIVGIIIGIALGLFGLGILEAILMALAMNSQHQALGSSAALLGAFPMLISSMATPIAGQLVEMNTLYWLFFLAMIGPVILALVFVGTRQTSAHSH